MRGARAIKPATLAVTFLSAAVIGAFAVRACSDGTERSPVAEQVALRPAGTAAETRGGWTASSETAPFKTQQGVGGSAPILEDEEKENGPDAAAGVPPVPGQIGGERPSVPARSRRPNTPDAGDRVHAGSGAAAPAETTSAAEEAAPNEEGAAGNEASAATDEEITAGRPVAAAGITFSNPMDFDLDAKSVFPGVGLGGDAGAVSFCLQPLWDGEDAADASLLGLAPASAPGSGLQITKSGTNLQFALADDTGIQTSTTANISAWQPGKGHLVTATWGQGTASLYVDGRLADQQTLQGQFQGSPDASLVVGAGSVPGSAAGQGSLSAVQVYGRTLQAGEIVMLRAGCR